MTTGAVYVALEGWEASGKSTQADLLAEVLEAVRVREPGGTALGDGIRGLLLHGAEVAPRAEALLFAADRAHLIETVVRPALEAGHNVVSDRSYLSSLAYQGHGRGFGVEELRRLNLWALGGTIPDLVVYLHMPLEQAAARLGHDRDRLESEAEAFHRSVVEGYSDLVRNDPDHWAEVDAGGSVVEVQNRIRSTLAERLGLDLPLLTEVRTAEPVPERGETVTAEPSPESGETVTAEPVPEPGDGSR